LLKNYDEAISRAKLTLI